VRTPFGDRDAGAARTVDLPDLESKYAAELSLAFEAMRLAGYEPAALRKLVSAAGARKASQLVADLPDPTEAFLALNRLGRLDLSVEAHMTKPECVGLFESASTAAAHARLVRYGYTAAR